MSRFGTGVLAAVCFALGIVSAIALFGGCSAARTGCDVIDVADHACEVLVLRVQHPDGTTREVVVRRSELLDLAREQDGGTP